MATRLNLRTEKPALLNTDTADLFRQAIGLNEHERATLDGLLIKSLEKEPDKDIEAEWKVESKNGAPNLFQGKF